MGVLTDTSVLAENHGAGVAWIGVDFDGTLARYDGWRAQGEALGEPVPAMAARVRRWISEGKYQVKIVTARAAQSAVRRDRDIALIQEWCVRHVGALLDVTAEKDFAMVALYDDRAVAVEMNTGRTFTYSEDVDPLTLEEYVSMIPRYEVPVVKE